MYLYKTMLMCHDNTQNSSPYFKTPASSTEGKGLGMVDKIQDNTWLKEEDFFTNNANSMQEWEMWFAGYFTTKLNAWNDGLLHGSLHSTKCVKALHSAYNDVK